MAAVHSPHPLRDHPQATRTVLDAFWTLAVGIIAAYVFFVMLGAFSPGDVAGVSIAVAVLLALVVARVVVERRQAGAAARARDPELRHARERRGF